MSIEITIKQKGLFKKELPFHVIVGSELKYGNFDGLRLDEDKVGEDGFIMYHPRHIARGIGVDFKKGEKNQVYMRLPSPTCAEEVDALYDAVERIIDYWGKCSVEQDGTILTMTELNAGRDAMKKFNLDTLKSFNSEEKPYPLTLFCALWPLVVGEKEKSYFGKAESLVEFRDWMHEKQSLDVYYAKPSFYRDESGFLGRYALTEETESVFPTSPYVPFGVSDPDNGIALEVGRWYLSMYSITKNTVIGMVQYEYFIDELGNDEKEYYDGSNIIIHGLDLARMEEICEKNNTEIG